MNKIKSKSSASIKSSHVLCDALITYADVIAHDQRSPICAINLANSFYENFISKLVAISKVGNDVTLHKFPLITAQELEEFQDCIEIIKSSTLKMSNIIDNSLKNIKNAISINQGKVSISDLTECDIVSENLSVNVFKSLLFGTKLNIFHTNLKYQFKYMGNKISMDQVITNLIQNALYQIKQNQQGEIFISTEDGGNFNLLKIKDTAGGASPEVVKSMFKQHFTTKADGHGVGLDFARKTMRLFGGDITAKSKHGEYIEFTLKFPKI